MAEAQAPKPRLTSSPSRILWIDSWISASWQISDSKIWELLKHHHFYMLSYLYQRGDRYIILRHVHNIWALKKCEMWMLRKKHVIVTARSRGDDDDVFSDDRGWLWWKLIGSYTILERWVVIPSYLNGQPQHCSVKITQTQNHLHNITQAHHSQTAQVATN